MKYYMNTIVKGHSFEAVKERLIAEMKKESFGVLTEADLQQAFKEKLNKDYRKYQILGACNPEYAYQALELEDKLGVYLPCNFIIQEREENTIEVSAVNPISMMSTVDNEALNQISKEIYDKMKRIIDAL